MRVALCIGVVAVLSLPLVENIGAARKADGVTISLQEFRLGTTRTLVFSGAVASDAAGETVDVLGWACGSRGSDFRVIGTTQTGGGGEWRVQNPSAEPPFRWTPVGSGMTFRARWKERLSDPVVYRLPANVWARRVSGSRVWKLHVIGEASGVSLAGKVVELQRRVGSRWTRYRSAPLVHKASFDLGPYNYEAVVSVPAHGLRLRGFLPKASARPCYLAAATKSWRS